MIALWSNFAVALGIGLLIGLERERSKADQRGTAGIRTFALASLLGAVAQQAGGVMLLAVALAGLVVLATLSYHRSRETDPGLTTEIGLLIAPLLGALAMSEALIAAGLGAAVTVLFAAKAAMHRFVKAALTDAEVKDGLIFAIATLVILPQLPDRPMGPYDAIIPSRIWMLVVLVLAIGAAGHVAARILGPRYGLPVAGLAAGFVSSTAATGAMAGRAKREPRSLASAVAAATFSTVATYIQMAMILAAISPPTLLAMAPALAAGALVAAGYAGFFAWRPAGTAPEPEAEGGRAFSVPAALGLAAVMAVMLVATEALKAWFGDAGLIAGTTVMGFADAHAPGVAIASMVAATRLAPEAAMVPILAAMTTNAVSKCLVAGSLGTGAFVRRAAPGIILPMLACWPVALLA
ncbi:MAG: DUF4010 domain-containing protein [Pseudomonadota bacterium]